MPILLENLLSELDFDRTGSAIPSIIIKGISDNSHQVEPGFLFVALKGFETDGHNYIQEAIDKGATAVIAQEDITARVPIFVVKNSRIALAQLCKTWFSFPCSPLKMIGVTASNGKTTTAFMIDSILSRQYPRTGLIGTVVVKDGKSTVSAGLTTPGSLELYEILSRMETNSCSHVTMELSSAGQQLNRIHGLVFDLVTFNNVTREHIDFHGSFENYWQVKTQVIRNLPSSATALLNADDAKILALKDETKADFLTYSLKGNPAHIQVTDIDLSTGAGFFRYSVPKPVESRNYHLPAWDKTFRLKVLGLHNIYNATVAITVGKYFSVPEEEIYSALETFSGVERRFQLIYDRDFKIIDDHFANVGNIELTLATLGLMKYRRLHLLIAIRGSRGSVVNKENTEALIKWLPLLPLGELIFTDSIDFAGHHDAVLPEERQAVLSTLVANEVKYRHFPYLADAIREVLQAAQADDVVLMGGCQGLDHGAHLAIPQLAKRFPYQESEKIMEILHGRVAGSS